MPRREQYVPKHRGPASEPALKKSIKKSVLYSGVAVAATGIAVSSGIVVQDDTSGDSASAALASALATHDSQPKDKASTVEAQAALRDRAPQVSRSDRRTAVDAVKKSTLDQASGGQATKTEDLTSQDPRAIAQALMPQFGFDSSQFSCLDTLWTHESGWNIHADNPTSSAYGIPQSLPGSKMATAGPDWSNNAETQIRWGLGYIRSSYGTPCGAWDFWAGHHWY